MDSLLTPLTGVPAILLAAFLGLAIGSFLNVVIHRLPRMMEQGWLLECAQLREEDPPKFEVLTLSRPRSRCPQCGHGISAVENIPILSYLFLRGHCRSCRARISIRYPLIEALTGLLSGFAVWHFGLNWACVGALVFIWCLIPLTFIDADTQLLPDSITLPLLWAGLLFNLNGTFVDLSSAVLGAVVGYLSLWAVYWLFKLVTGKEGMGYGDFKLLAAVGAWLGWQLLPLVILLSALAGAVIGLSLIVFARHGRNIPIPFGPYLACAALIALFWGETLNRHYLGLL